MHLLINCVYSMVLAVALFHTRYKILGSTQHDGPDIIQFDLVILRLLLSRGDKPQGITQGVPTRSI